MKSVEETFSRESFLEMFKEEIFRCYKNALDKSCKGPIPEEILLYRVSMEIEPDWEPGLKKVKLAKQCILDIDSTVDTLLDDRGWYPEWIHISPFAVTETHLILEICSSETWTNKRFIEGYFPKEPFQLRGPSLPPGWKPDQPFPKVVLPILEVTNA